MSGYKHTVTCAIGQCQAVDFDGDAPGSYVVITDGDTLPTTRARVIYDSWETWPADAPKAVRALDYALGPGYWTRARSVDDPASPPKTHPRLLVVDVHVARDNKDEHVVIASARLSIRSRRCDDVIDVKDAKTQDNDTANEHKDRVDIKANDDANGANRGHRRHET